MESPHLAQVSVVIPSLRPTDRLARCLEAVAAQSVRPVGVWVVLTARTSREPEQEQRWPDVHVMACPPPRSFCRAVNAGIAKTTTPWVLVLNDDVVMKPDYIERLVSGMPSDPRVGMVCGKLLSEDGRRLDSTGQFVSRVRTAVERGHGSSRVDRFSRPGPVFSVPAAAALYRRTMLEAIAKQGRYFDERYRMYLEDLELGWRAQRAGWRAAYVPDAIAWHLRGATAKTRTPRWSWLRRYYLPQLAPALQVRYVLNRYRLIAEYDTPPMVLVHLPWLLWYELKLWLYLVVCERHTIRLIHRVLSRKQASDDAPSRSVREAIRDSAHQQSRA
ncbi:MAG: glycosyltransferase family 2 protein [Candidatus Omnitrophica bacterium]|nr:glycosyltransferase family 2 protein [Candidatus Omnitrophota bacterium]